MRILIADDDEPSRLALSSMLMKLGHLVVSVANGADAWQVLEAPDAPPLAILDWMMPGLDGVEICRRVRADAALRTVYVILLTSRDAKEHLLEGLAAGANDYVTKPFDHEELQARVNVGVQVAYLQDQLRERVSQLEDALTRVKRLQGLLPICAYCKSIRDDQQYWHQVDAYLQAFTDARFTHGVCPDCWNKTVKPEMQKLGLPASDPSAH